MSDKVLVTGATGAVGPKVIDELLRSNLHVCALVHNQRHTANIPDSVETSTGDILDLDSLMAAMEGCTYIVHLAALLHIPNPSPSMLQQYRQINVVGTQQVITAAKANHIKRVVFASSIAVYGHTRDLVANELTPPQPDTLYGTTKLDAERVVLEAHDSDDAPLGTVLRLAAVYGDRVKGNYERLLVNLAHDRFIPIGSGSNRRTLVYDGDVARAVALALQHPAAAGKIYNVTDGTTHTMQEIIAAVCAALGKAPPRLSLPIGPVRFAVDVSERIALRLGVRPPLASTTLEKYFEDTAVDGQLICSKLGFVPQYDLRTGWKETVTKMRASGALRR